MARIRSVKPETWSDRALARLSRDARLLYIALWNEADEHGRLQGDPRYIKGRCFPYDDDLGATEVAGLLVELEHHGKVQRYEVDTDPYLYLPNLAEHQRLEPEKVASRLPEPPTRTGSTDQDADESESRADESAQDAEKNALLYVAGSREHVSTSDEPTHESRREDVDAICTRLVERMVANDCRAPTITDRWRKSARLLLDADERPLEEALSLIDWCQSSPFWAPNIQSLPKFREKYDTLRLQQVNEREAKPRNPRDDPGYRPRDAHLYQYDRGAS